jgi:hypothetical protein
MDIEAVVIYGHKLHSHTHSYIHEAFVRAFDYFRYKWYWLDDSKTLQQWGVKLPKKCLFITEGQVDKKIPLIPESYYVLHNCDIKKYSEAGIPDNHILILQVFTNSCIPHSVPLNDSEFIRFDGKVLYMPWGSDLHPHEIDNNIAKLENISKSYKPVCHFVGMILDNPWKLCQEECKKHKISFSSVGGFSKNNVSLEENMKRVQEAIIAPAFQEPWQVEHGYIPCRIFKNISYGKMGITNNETVQKIFGGKLIYDKNVKTATNKSIEYIKKGEDLELLKSLMIEVRDKHTYINRIKDIFEAFSRL